MKVNTGMIVLAAGAAYLWSKREETGEEMTRNHIMLLVGGAAIAYYLWK